MVSRKKPSIEEAFWGAVTVGERGQVVIPAAARKRYDIKPRDKLLVFSHPFDEGLVLAKVDALQEMLSELVSGLSRIQAVVQENAQPGGAARSKKAPRRGE